jgi:DNA integrity scanning protein DisA with diadenylate cyclase activity
MDEIAVLNNLLTLDGIDNYRNTDEYYKDGDKAVPRVSEILKFCSDQEGLINWAASIGYGKMKAVREKATTVGTRVHNMIEHYVTTGQDADMPPLRFDYEQEVITSYENFKQWLSAVQSRYGTVETIAIEKVLTCPWYGGTTDWIVKINGANYIADFKTSKKIDTNYLVQAAAYMWIINNGYAPDLPHIDGIGIIRVPKYGNGFEDVFLNEFNPVQNQMIVQYQQAFLSFLNAWYRNININFNYKLYKRSYERDQVLGGTVDEIE